MKSSNGQKILIVDDDERLRRRLSKSFRLRGLQVVAAAGCEDALTCFTEADPDLVVIDLKMLDGSGLTLLPALKRLKPTIKAVILTGYGSISTTVEAMRLGAVNYLQKPVDADGILRAFSEQTNDEPRQDMNNYQPPSLHRAEWEHIQRVLHDCNGNITLAAEKLGLHRRTLQRKLKKIPSSTE